MRRARPDRRVSQSELPADSGRGPSGRSGNEASSRARREGRRCEAAERQLFLLLFFSLCNQRRILVSHLGVKIGHFAVDLLKGRGKAEKRRGLEKGITVQPAFDHVAVLRIDFHPDAVSSRLHGGQHGGSRPAEWITNNVTDK